MTQTILTPTAVTRECLRILHQKLTFCSNIDRQYDDSFAKEGGKIGDSLKIRLPNEYTVRTGAKLTTQETSEQSVTLQVATQKGVDLNFTSAELTMDLDDFSKRIIDPAMSVLAADLEADAYSMYKDVYQVVDGDTASITFKHLMQGRALLQKALAPQDRNRTCMLSTDHNVDLIDVLKGLFNSQDTIGKQNREGVLGRTAGMNFFENTHVSDHTTGSAVKTTTYLCNDATPQTGSTLTIDTGSTTFLKGDIVTIASVYNVHPETKVTDGTNLKTFVVTADSGASATSLSISPAIVASGGRQNVSAAAANNAAVNKICAAANETMTSSMVFHKDAFALVTADLEMPKGVDFAHRTNFDGVSMRIVRAYDINNDAFPCRLDILYGYKTLRAQLAARIHADG